MPLKPAHHHPWDLAPREARELQLRLAGKAELADRFGALERVAGIDIGFEQRGAVTRAAVAVLQLSNLELVEHAVARLPTAFPYVPGLLSFREIPAAVQALAALEGTADLLMCDGQGFAHPRRFGLACHLGWLMDLPCIGVAKSRLIGTFEEPGAERGAWSALTDRGAPLGAALRSRARTKPVFVSQGYRVSLESAIRLALACTGRYRVPEPTRQAHRLASTP
ncbi:MAG: deoxyribonuclease V [Geminicoccaceae bacterium]